MDIRGAIDKATQLPRTSGQPSFIKLKKPDQATIDRNMNRRKLKAPRNIKLIEQDDDPETHDWDIGYPLNENEILSSIKAVNGGVSYSNKSYEDHWKSKQLDQNSNTQNCKATTSNSKQPCNSEKSNIVNTNSTKSKEKTENHKDPESIHEVLKKCSLSKNAVISGLLNSNQITLEDLKIPEKPNLKNEKSQNQSDINTRENVNGNCLVLHPDEPDIYIHPLQMPERFEKTKGDAADYVIEHVGVKKTITPRQYYINETDDMSFEFVKKNVKGK